MSDQGLMAYQRLSVTLGEGHFFDLYKTSLFVITGSHGEPRENSQEVASDNYRTG